MELRILRLIQLLSFFLSLFSSRFKSASPSQPPGTSSPHPLLSFLLYLSSLFCLVHWSNFKSNLTINHRAFDSNYVHSSVHWAASVIHFIRDPRFRLTEPSQWLVRHQKISFDMFSSISLPSSVRLLPNVIKSFLFIYLKHLLEHILVLCIWVFSFGIFSELFVELILCIKQFGTDHFTTYARGIEFASI